MSDRSNDLSSRAVMVVAALLSVATLLGLLDLAAPGTIAPHRPTAVILAAVACASLTTAGFMAFRASDDDRTGPVLMVSIGIVLLGVGTIGVALRAGQSVEQDPGLGTMAVLLASAMWVGRGLLTVGLASHERGQDWVVNAGVAAATLLGVVGVFERSGTGTPSDIERLAALLMAATLVSIAVKWLRTSTARPALYGSVAFLACGLGLAFVFGSTTARAGDGRELSALAWLVLASALSAAWLDRRNTTFRKERERIAFEALRIAEHQRVLLESTDLAHSVVRHDSRSSLTAVEGGVQALVDLHDKGDSDTFHRMAAVVLAELGRVRRMLEGTRQRETSIITEVIAPLAALHRAAGLELTVDVDPPDVEVAVPSDHLAEVLENLLRNARTHAPGASVRIRGRAIIGNTRLLLTISDDGPGIDSRIAPYVFDSTVSTAGSGLGLHAVRTLLGAHGARADIEPTFRGTSIRIDLPISSLTAHDGDGDGEIIDLRDRSDRGPS